VQEKKIGGRYWKRSKEKESEGKIGGAGTSGMYKSKGWGKKQTLNLEAGKFGRCCGRRTPTPREWGGELG